MWIAQKYTRIVLPQTTNIELENHPIETGTSISKPPLFGGFNTFNGGNDVTLPSTFTELLEHEWWLVKLPYPPEMVFSWPSQEKAMVNN